MKLIITTQYDNLDEEHLSDLLQTWIDDPEFFLNKDMVKILVTQQNLVVETGCSENDVTVLTEIYLIRNDSENWCKWIKINQKKKNPMSR